MSLKSDADAMARRLNYVAQHHPTLVRKGLYIEGQIELTETKKRCPVSPTAAQYRMMGITPPRNHVPGSLRASGQLIMNEDPKVISATIAYGSASVAYAEIQHERLDFFHTNGQAKYVSSVLDESRPYIAERVAKRAHVDKLEVPWRF